MTGQEPGLEGQGNPLQKAPLHKEVWNLKRCLFLNISQIKHFWNKVLGSLKPPGIAPGRRPFWTGIPTSGQE